tara:strand:+ start:1013 stop:1633 length:621 start_codon:yes stop_codon:yes gene_type:complete
MENKQIMKDAQESLKGKWGISIAVCLVAGIIAILATLLGGYLINEDWGGNILSLLITPPLGVGLALFFLNVCEGKSLEMKTLFNPFKEVWLNSVLAYFMMIVVVSIGTILFIIPGIIATLMFSQVLYIIAEDKEIDPYNALVKSKQMMQGNKWKLFKILIRILLLAIACILTLGIGFIWLAPYQNAVYAKFYKVIIEDRTFKERIQ